MTRVHVPGPLQALQSVELPRDAAAHVLKVLRARPGDEIILFDGDGHEYAGRIDQARAERVSVSIEQRRAVDRESPLHVTLVQALPRGDRMDFVVQKATELGVKRIVPVLSRRSVMRLDAKQAASKLAHWRGVAISACEQCGRNMLPEVAAPRDLLAHLAEAAAVPPSIASPPSIAHPPSIAGPSPVAHPLRIVLDPSADSAPDAVLTAASRAPIEIIIGPEGGFDTEELEAMRLVGTIGMRLGPRILRTETAALAALAALQARYGDL